MEGAEITPDEHNERVHKKFIEDLKMVPDPTPECPNAKRPEIKLPWTSKASKCSNNKHLSLKRLHLLLQKFETNKKMEEIYSKQMKDWEAWGFIEKVPLEMLDQLEKDNKWYVVWYIQRSVLFRAVAFQFGGGKGVK